jgi:hypothetical protein
MARLVLLVVLTVLAPVVQAAERLALFPFELINTSLEPTRPDEAARLQALLGQAGEQLAAGYQLVDTTPVAQQVAGIGSLQGCNGCDLDLARQLGADLAGVGWVQKVSNLMLNVNVVIRDTATREQVFAGSVDIRGNTDESWRHGIRYLLKNRLLKE